MNVRNASQTQVYENILQAVGNTPLIKLNRITAEACSCTVLAKVEFFNPAGSVKDRVGAEIIADAEAKGLIRPGGTIVEATSGNTGAGLALAAVVKGYRCVFVMPDKMSEEKVRFLLQRRPAHCRRNPQQPAGKPVLQPRQPRSARENHRP